MAHTVELVRPSLEPSDQKKHDRFDRGERIITVDGVRWGRTIVTHHGVNGTVHTFKQDNGDVILDQERPGREINVRSMRKRSWLPDDEWRPTEERVLGMARLLVETGRLRDPKIVEHENREAHERWQKHRAEAEKKAEARMRCRACEALQMNQDDGTDVIDRVVAAMKWAQTQ